LCILKLASTPFYKENRKETRAEVFVEVVQKMSRQGVTPENIAQTLEMELADIKKILKEKAKKCP